MDGSVLDILTLAEWRRLVAEMYAEVRADVDPEHAWRRWCGQRRTLFTSHPQSPIPAEARAAFAGPVVFDYDPRARVTAELVAVEGGTVQMGTSDGGVTPMLRFAEARFELFGEAASLEVFWLDQYGGGIYLSFRDASSGDSTYGGGRYLLDTAKGADLGAVGERLILDFNFAYQPSCSHDPRWACPLPPPQNRLSLPVAAGERLA